MEDPVKEKCDKVKGKMLGDTLYLKVDEEDFEKFTSSSSDDERWKIMETFSAVAYHKDNARSEILQEYLFHILHFSFVHELSYEQMSSVVALSEKYFSRCVLDATIQHDDAKNIFRELINEYLLQRDKLAENNAICLSTLKSLTGFFVENFIRHLSLYQAVFSRHQNEIVESKHIATQTPMLCSPLMQATHYNGQQMELETARTDYTTEKETARTDYTEFSEEDEQ